MNTGKSIDQQIVNFLKKKGSGTVDDIAAAVKISRTSARKYLAGLTVKKTVRREPGGRDGRRKLPDVFSLPGKKRRGKPAKRRLLRRRKTGASDRAGWISTSSTTCESTKRRRRTLHTPSPKPLSAPRELWRTASAA